MGRKFAPPERAGAAEWQLSGQKSSRRKPEPREALVSNSSAAVANNESFRRNDEKGAEKQRQIESNFAAASRGAQVEAGRGRPRGFGI